MTDAIRDHAVMWLPPHEAGLYLSHNDQRSMYRTVQQELEAIDHLNDDDVWPSAEAKQRAIDTDSMWKLQWYPDTPVGFNVVCAPTLEELLALARKVCDA
jgi:hypothetical protein